MNHQVLPRFGGLVAPLAAAAVFALACGAMGTAAPRDAGGGAAMTGPKTLTVGLQLEPASVILYGRPGEGGNTSARFERFFVFHANLTMFDRERNVVPHTAQKVPSIEDGDWKVNPEGTMEVTWKIRPDVYWHDGTPLTAEDFVFGFEVMGNPQLAVSTVGEVSNMSSVRAADPKTLVINWKITSINGNTNSAEGLPAIARHQVEPIYRSGDLPAFEASQVWRTEYVGLGPYKVGAWELGSHVESLAFDQYFLGRPKVDRIIWRWVTDFPVMVANVLSGVVDVVSPGGEIKPDQMSEIRRQWGPGKGVVMSSPNDIRSLGLNFKVEGQPWDPQQAGWQRDVRFRQAMLHSIDKKELTEILQLGFVDAAEYFAFPEDAVYRLAAQRGVPRYPYDPSRAQQLFAAAGWTKGGDGLLRNSAGQTAFFPCCEFADANSNDARESTGWATHLKAAGIDIQDPIPAPSAGLSSTENRKARTVGWGGVVMNYRVTSDQNFASFIAANIAREETRWAGINAGAWTTPAYESTFTRAMSTLNAAQRLEIEFEMMKLIMDDLPRFPVYYSPNGLVVREGVTGISKGVPLNRGITWNIHTWDIK